MYTNIKKIVALVVLVALTGAQCWGAAVADGTPLMKAAKNGDVVAVRRLINSGADVNEKGDGGATALMAAIRTFRGGADQIIKMLLAAGAEVNATNDHGWTALMLAARFNGYKEAEILLRAGADKDIINNAGQRAVDEAIAAGDRKMVDMLTPYTGPQS